MLHSGAFINKTERIYKTYKNEKYRQEVDERGWIFKHVSCKKQY